MKNRFKTFTLLFALLTASSTKSQYLGLNAGRDQIFGRSGTEYLGLVLGYNFTDRIKGDVFYAKFGRSFFENHKIGAQAKYALPITEKRDVNLLAGAGSAIHFGGYYPTKKIIEAWPSLSYVDHKNKALTYYGLIGLEAKFGHWSIPLEIKAGKQHAFGNDKININQPNPQGLETEEVSVLGYGGASIGLIYEF